MRPGYTQSEVTHPVLGWGGANFRLQHLGRIPNCSEVPDSFFLWHFVQFCSYYYCNAHICEFGILRTKGVLH